MTTQETTLCGETIRYDNSGVGHNWRVIDASKLPYSIREEIAAEIIDGRNQNRNLYIATNGLHYSW